MSENLSQINPATSMNRPVLRTVGKCGASIQDTFAYNPRGEIVFFRRDAENAEDTYSYDDIGNRITSFDLGTNRTYIANNLNQYTQISNLCDSASLCEEFNPQFDDDGNQTLVQTATGIWQVQYNGENRPVLWENVSTNSPTPNSSTPPLISMSYDRMGRRVTKNNQRFVYNGYLQMANFEHQTSTNKLQTFIWDPSEPVATRPLVWARNDSASYYFHDGNKNVSEVVGVNGLLAAQYEYAPFGGLTLTIGECAFSNYWRFSSEYMDDEVKFVYYNYRHYDLISGRWIGRDPKFEFWNEYCACYNYLFNFDVLGLYRMVSGWLYNPKSGTENQLRAKIHQEILYINDIMSPSCYSVRFRDLEYATSKDINDAAKDRNTEVIVVGHGHKKPTVGYGLNTGSSIPISELNLPSDNMLGCYISPWVRGEDKDTYSVMFNGLLARLIELTPKMAKCCEKKTILIYEGEFSNKKLEPEKLKSMGNEDVDWRWHKVDQEEAIKRKDDRDIDLIKWMESDQWKKTHPTTQL